MRHAVPRLLLLVLLATAAACSLKASRDPAQPPPLETKVVVRNQKHVDMTLYVLSGTQRVRLGLVPGLGTRTFTIPPHLLSSSPMLRFGFDVIGDSGMRVSEEVQLSEGEQLELSVPY